MELVHVHVFQVFVIESNILNWLLFYVTIVINLYTKNKQAHMCTHDDNKQNTGNKTNNNNNINKTMSTIIKIKYYQHKIPDMVDPRAFIVLLGCHR